MRLWTATYPDTKLESRVSEQWKSLGFQVYFLALPLPIPLSPLPSLFPLSTSINLFIYICFRELTQQQIFVEWECWDSSNLFILLKIIVVCTPLLSSPLLSYTSFLLFSLQKLIFSFLFSCLLLSSLLFSSFVQQDIFRKIVNGQIARKEREYPVAVAGINITQKLYDILKINDEAGRM